MGETITVVSKLPMNFVLHLEAPVQEKEATPLGNISTTRHRPIVGKTITIRGVARDLQKPDNNPLESGFALTHGVDKAFWDKWLSEHLTFAPVVSGALFAVGKKQDAKVEAKNRAHTITGFEPADPGNLPAEFKNKITKAD